MAEEKEDVYKKYNFLLPKTKRGAMAWFFCLLIFVMLEIVVYAPNINNPGLIGGVPIIYLWYIIWWAIAIVFLAFYFLTEAGVE